MTDFDLFTIRAAYDSAWLELPFTNVNAIWEMLLAIKFANTTSRWLTGLLPHQRLTSFCDTAKSNIYLNEEGSTCGPFAVVVGEKLNPDEWKVDYLHTGRHGAAVAYKVKSPQVLYFVDSSTRSVYCIPSSRYLWSLGSHVYSIYSHPPSFPHVISPVVYRSLDPLYYTEKGGNNREELCPSTKQVLIKKPIDAISTDPLPVLLIRHRVGNTNGFAVHIKYDMRSATVTFFGPSINEKFVLAGLSGQPRWGHFAEFLLRLKSFKRLYPNQLSDRLFSRFVVVIYTMLQSHGMAC